MTQTLTERTREEAQANGYAVFNNNPHICIDLDHQATITVNTPKGQITFAFMPYTKDGSPNCVDVCCHNDEQKQKAIVFGYKDGKSRWDYRKNEPSGLITVILDENL